MGLTGRPPQWLSQYYGRLQYTYRQLIQNSGGGAHNEGAFIGMGWDGLEWVGMGLGWGGGDKNNNNKVATKLLHRWVSPPAPSSSSWTGDSEIWPAQQYGCLVRPNKSQDEKYQNWPPDQGLRRQLEKEVRLAKVVIIRIVTLIGGK